MQAKQDSPEAAEFAFDLDPSATERELQQQNIFDMFKDDNQIIHFQSTEFHQIVQGVLHQRMHEYLAESKKLFQYNMQKQMYTDKQIKKVGNKLERQSDMERFKLAWNEQLDKLESETKKFNKLNQEGLHGLVESVKEEYISKWLARNIKLSNLGKNITD
jgi:hypothetical protein